MPNGKVVVAMTIVLRLQKKIKKNPSVKNKKKRSSPAQNNAKNKVTKEKKTVVKKKARK